MTNTINSQEVVTETKQYFSETIKYIYFNNKLTFKQWRMYFNILKAALETNTPTENLLNFAQALDLATVMFDYKPGRTHEETIDYSLMKIELHEIIKGLKDPKIVTDNKSLILKPNASLVQTTAKKQ